MNDQIDPETTMGRVSLTVSELETSLDYYRHVIGLQVQRREDEVAFLGVNGRELLVLRSGAGTPHVQGTTGLYHFALLLPSRLDLALILQHLREIGAPIGGFADHAVSEAIYLSDPDGHGIEIYRDRPRDEWAFPGGQLRMTVDPFDFDGVLSELENGEREWSGLPVETVMGHVHLHVAHIQPAEWFYVEVLGFDLVVRYGAQASFVSAGGYHHHLGLNTWAGVGAPKAPRNAAQLQWYEVQLPDWAALMEVIDRVEAAEVPYEEVEGGFSVRDPSENGVLLMAVED